MVVYLCIVMMPLNFSRYAFRFKSTEKKVHIFDEIRKRFFVLTPEEWVRQHCVQFLIEDLNIPKSYINVEKEVKVNSMSKRYDIISFNKDASIHLIVECKAPHIKINQETFDQIARYNLTLNAKYLMVTNGLQHYYCQMNLDTESYTFIKELPMYNLD